MYNIRVILDREQEIKLLEQLKNIDTNMFGKCSRVFIAEYKEEDLEIRRDKLQKEFEVRRQLREKELQDEGVDEIDYIVNEQTKLCIEDDNFGEGVENSKELFTFHYSENFLEAIVNKLHMEDSELCVEKNLAMFLGIDSNYKEPEIAYVGESPKSLSFNGDVVVLCDGDIYKSSRGKIIVSKSTLIDCMLDLRKFINDIS